MNFDIRTRKGLVTALSSVAVIIMAVFGTMYFVMRSKPAPPVQTSTKQTPAPAPQVKICAPHSYTVVKGDWLIKRAKIEYGDKGNRENFFNGFRLGKYNSLKDPNIIHVRDMIIVPCIEDLMKVKDFLPTPNKAQAHTGTEEKVSSIQKVFIAPDRATVQAETATIPAPEIILHAQVELPMLATEFPTLAPPSPVEQVAVTEVASEPTHAFVPLQQVVLRQKAVDIPRDIPQPIVAAPPLAPTLAPKRIAKGKQIYRVYLQVPKGALGETADGQHPALFLRDNKKGEWHHRDHITVKIQSSQARNIAEIKVELEKNPPRNSVLLFNFGEGKIFPVGSDLISHGAMVSGVLPKPLDKKAYASLEAGFPSAHHGMVKMAVLVLPTLGQATLGFVMGGGPLGLIPVGTSTLSRFISGKIRANKQGNTPPPQVINGAQQNEIDALRAQNAEINSRLQSIETSLQPSTTQTRLAMEVSK